MTETIVGYSTLRMVSSSELDLVATFGGSI